MQHWSRMMGELLMINAELMTAIDKAQERRWTSHYSRKSTTPILGNEAKIDEVWNDHLQDLLAIQRKRAESPDEQP